MPKLKVKQLHHSMKTGQFDLVPTGFHLIGRDGFYCRGDDVWFEYRGCGYVPYQGLKSRAHFEYDLRVNDEAILMQREVVAFKTILKTTRDAKVRKAVGDRLQLHMDAYYLRQIRRGIRR